MQRVQLLFNQKRYADAKTILEQHLSISPTSYFARKALMYCLLRLGENDESRRMCEALLTEFPEDADLMKHSIEIDIDDEYLDRAESKVKMLKELSHLDQSVFILEAHIKLAQNNYDKALEAAERALEIEANDPEALNLKIMIENILGKGNLNADIEHVLELNPENPSTIANHALHFLHNDKPKEALERAREALQKDPNNELAQFVMAKAMKSQFLLYRLFFKYSNMMGRLTANGSWGFMIGAYIFYRIVLRIGESYPFLMPLAYVILGLFVLTWIMEPLFNLYLYSNKYGRLLLSKNQKIMSICVGISLLIGLLCLAVSFLFPSPGLILFALMCGLMAIPLGSFLQPTKKSNRNKLIYFTGAILLCGLLACFGVKYFILVFLLGIFAYQWIVNGIMIKESARVID